MGVLNVRRGERRRRRLKKKEKRKGGMDIEIVES